MFKFIVLLGLVAATAAAPSGRVVNGTDANIADYPYMVSIKVGSSHNCGGSILNANYILTAAHCSGSVVEYGTDKLGQGKSISVANWTRNPFYDGFTLEHDIAVVELSTPIEFGENVRPVTLPEPYYEVPGSWETKARLSGFGYDRVSLKWFF